jgi:hypothetical protein
MLKVCTLMDVLYASNRENARLSYKEFYNDKVNKNEQYRKVARLFTIDSNQKVAH